MEQLTYLCLVWAGTWELTKDEHWEWYLVLIHLVRLSLQGSLLVMGAKGWVEEVGAELARVRPTSEKLCTEEVPQKNSHTTQH